MGKGWVSEHGPLLHLIAAYYAGMTPGSDLGSQSQNARAVDPHLKARLTEHDLLGPDGDLNLDGDAINLFAALRIEALVANISGASGPRTSTLLNLTAQIFQAQTLTALEIENACIQQAINARLVKAHAYYRRIPPGIPAGTHADIDLVVADDWVFSLSSVLYGLGFVPGDFNKVTGKIARVSYEQARRVESAEGQLYPFLRVSTSPSTPICPAALDTRFYRDRLHLHFCDFENSELRVITSVDVHTKLHFGLDGILAWEDPSCLQSTESHIAILCKKYYSELTFGKTFAFRDFLNLIRMLQESNKVDAEGLIDLGNKSGALNAIYYLLLAANRYVCTPDLDLMVRMLNQARGKEIGSDFGDQIAFTFGA